MSKLAIIAVLSLAFSMLLCYGAMRVAEAIAKTSTERQELAEMSQ